jgi:hypothetical protein
MIERKIVDLELAEEFLGQNSKDGTDSRNASSLEKKKLAAARKELKELRDRFPIEISVSFKDPWWSSNGK